MTLSEFGKSSKESLYAVLELKGECYGLQNVMAYRNAIEMALLQEEGGLKEIQHHDKGSEGREPYIPF